MNKSSLKMLDILQLVAVTGQPMGLTEIANEVDMDKTTASRMLNSLLSRDFVVRDPKTKEYRVGPGFLGVASAVVSRAEIIRTIQPFMERLAAETGELVNLIVRTNLERVCISTVERFPPLLQRRTLGMRIPLTSGTAGKTILAFLDEDVIDEAIELFPPVIPEDELRAQLQQIRQQGYFEDVAEQQTFLGAASVALFNRHGVFGVLNIVGEIERLTPTARRDLLPVMRDVAAKISKVVSDTHTTFYY